jgi:hypothetical protein
MGAQLCELGVCLRNEHSLVYPYLCRHASDCLMCGMTAFNSKFCPALPLQEVLVNHNTLSTVLTGRSKAEQTWQLLGPSQAAAHA